MLTSSVHFDVPARTAFDYLVDPRNRPAWQSSLRRIEDLSSETPQVGQSWTDVTSPGLRAAMVTTVLDPPRVWTERGTWRGIAAELTLRFVDVPLGCTVTAEVRVTGSGLLRPAGPVITAAAAAAVPTDLKKAARSLSARASGQ
ncbi:MAG: SRPBCC family protein [Propionibacteriales bacterium]|nr:SRPBCC family protein [Propionibacteriales bacterium]